MTAKAMRSHHRQAINRLRERFQDDPRSLALIVGGSVAKGIARDDSDVDVVFVATDEEWARRSAAGDYFQHIGDICDYDGGYIDGKVVDLRYLHDAADHGNEPTRFSFVDSFVICSRVPELDGIIKRIAVYPEAERREKIEAFYSQVVLYATFFIPEAEKWQNPYLLGQASASLVLFGGRLILAHNRVLFPSHKWLMAAVESAPDKPAEFMNLAHEVLSRPGRETGDAFYQCREGYRDWGLTREQAVNRYIRDAEWHWRSGRPPIQDW
jgi:predicted nucleotidyltransferase